ncbi:Aldehyde/histidinol dehydrogenase [Halenospora varia]|nr:Aldehyde/histidinol dehydrogenase [Halenospora varia]
MAFLRPLISRIFLKPIFIAHKVTLTAPSGKEVSFSRRLFINNEFVKGSSTQKITSTDPATEEYICTDEVATSADVNKVVKVAGTAFNNPNNLEDLFTLQAWDVGKPFTSPMKGEGAHMLGTLRHFAVWDDKIHSQTILVSKDEFGYTLRQPVDAGYSPGVDQALNGCGKITSEALTTHMDVDKIAFTGSTATGKRVIQAAVVNIKKTSIEAGGKSAFVIFDDIDLEQAAGWAIAGGLGNSGQICSTNSRIRTKRGDFIQPTTFTGVTKDMKIFQEEVFGPILAVTTFKTEDEAVSLANDTTYGLAAMIFTENLKIAHHTAAKLRTGIVWIKRVITLFTRKGTGKTTFNLLQA